MNLLDAAKPAFAQHETFYPRYGWFRKAYSFADLNPFVFSDEDAALQLGVGKNMVEGIRTWGLATKILEEIEPLFAANPTRLEPTKFGRDLLGSMGWDPFVEDLGTLWLMHWRIMAPKSRLPVWWLAFNDFEDVEFNKDDLQTSVTKKLADTSWHLPSTNTIEKEIKALLRTYAPPLNSKRPWVVTFEDYLKCPLRKLELIRHSDTKGRYQFNFAPKTSLPPAILCHASLDFASRTRLGNASISFASLLEEPGAPGKTFKVSEEELLNSIKRTARAVSSVHVKDVDGEPHLFWSDSPRHAASEILNAQYGRPGTIRTPQHRRSLAAKSACPHATPKSGTPELDWRALIEHLKDARELQPEVAARHSAEYDLIRVFSFDYTLSNDPCLPLDPTSPYDGKVLLVAGPNLEPPPIRPGSSAGKPTLAAIPEDLAPLKAAALQVIRLTKKNTTETSPVSTPELEAAQAEFRRVADETFKSENCRWVLLDPTRNKELPPERRSGTLSTVADIEYPSTPKLRNEMINAWPKLTTPGRSTRRKLLRAMIEKGGEDGLGFTGYKPEVAMYRSVLRRTGLHRRDKLSGAMFFCTPSSVSLRPAWKILNSAVADYRTRRLPLDQLHVLLLSPPVGMRKAAVAVFLTAWMLAAENRLRIFEGENEVSLDAESVLKMAERPEQFSLEIEPAN